MFWHKNVCFQTCRSVLQQRKYDLWKRRMHMRESVLWTMLPVGLRQLTGRLFQPNPFLFTPWIIELVGKAALVVPKPKKGHAGGCPACRARKIVEHFWYLPNVFFSFHFHFFLSQRGGLHKLWLLKQIRRCLNGVRSSLWAAFRGRWHTGDESSCLDRCWGHTSQPPHVCEVSGMVLTSDARLQRTSSIRPLSLSQHTGGKWRTAADAAQSAI